MSSSNVLVGAPVEVKTTIILSPVELSGGGSVYTASVWTGEGPPHLVMGASIGDEYYDILSGTLYRLDPGE